MWQTLTEKELSNDGIQLGMYLFANLAVLFKLFKTLLTPPPPLLNNIQKAATLLAKRYILYS